ncbi:protein turtle-like [Rhagoletis pomonella]|uniref:protein turtle-like n=1 Tax=Rhagoletis pomonella TaxID=28610 RepID=UPI001783CD4E|nr:protein turtle-like [Rhagoletis pomonella]XP_036344208.1 protein turtle-like [Rhagoletis pomonella]
MGVCADPGSYRWCQALSRSRSSFATNNYNKNINTNCCTTIQDTYINNPTITLPKRTATATGTTKTNSNLQTISKSLVNRKSTKFQTITENLNFEINQSNREQLDCSSERSSSGSSSSNNKNPSLLVKVNQFIILLLVFLAKTAYANIPG